MKLFRLITATAFFAVLLAVPAFAQNTAKVAIVDSRYFYDQKAGITKFVAAYKQLDTEFKPRLDELVALDGRLKKAADEYAVLVKGDPNVVAQKSLDAKREEGEKLALEFKYKKEQYDAAEARRTEAIMKPIADDIGKALQEYAKAKGYQLIFDRGKDEKQMLIWANMAEVDMTADFIKFFNARPATTAGVTK